MQSSTQPNLNGKYRRRSLGFSRRFPLDWKEKEPGVDGNFSSQPSHLPIHRDGKTVNLFYSVWSVEGEVGSYICPI